MRTSKGSDVQITGAIPAKLSDFKIDPPFPPWHRSKERCTDPGNYDLAPDVKTNPVLKISGGGLCQLAQAGQLCAFCSPADGHFEFYRT
jgi:hypothetical protein